ncbi:MAG: gluconeogenesis factor YvcK family protein [Patescibacteria group bacterium]
MKKIVCFGGGSALPKVVLEPLKKYPIKITAVAAMLESGGSSGQLRVDFGVLPMGDIRRQILALSEAPEWKKRLFEFRPGREVFDDGHKGHVFGNIFLSGLEYIFKDTKMALKAAQEFMEVRGEILPATIENGHLCAILENGMTIFGEDEIDVPKKHNPNLKIKEVFTNTKVKAFPATLKAIKQADLIVVGPGDLYSSLIPCFLPEGMKRAVQKTKAKKVLVCNLMTKIGETNKFTVSNFVEEIEKYLGTKLDFIIYNTGKPSPRKLKEYKKYHPELMEMVKFPQNLSKDKKFFGANLLKSSSEVIHNPDKVAKILLKL